MLVAVGFYSGWLFSIGHYCAGVLAAFLSLAASILDGCDGEIARLKYQESALGCWIETVGDYSYYIAIFVGPHGRRRPPDRVRVFYWIGALALTGTLITFALLIYLRARITTASRTGCTPSRTTASRPSRACGRRSIWRISFVATRAAMPYGIMAFALLNMLPGDHRPRRHRREYLLAQLWCSSCAICCGDEDTVALRLSIRHCELPNSNCECIDSSRIQRGLH